MKRRQITAMLLTAALCLASGGCRQEASPDLSLFEPPQPAQSVSQPQYIYLTHSADTGSFTHRAAKILEQAVEDISQGQFEVEVFPNDTLGSVAEANYALQNGSVQMRIGSGPSTIVTLLGYPLLTGLDLAGLQDALDQNTKLQKLMQEECEAYGVRIIGMLPLSYRVLTSNRPVTSADDIRGMKMRISDYHLSELYWSSLGAMVVKLPLEEVYGAMQQGVVDGNPEVTPGGRALKFYSSVRMEVRRVEQLKSGTEMIGNRTRVKIVKNKVAPPFKEAEFDIMYGTGISREGEILDLAVKLDIINKSGAWFSYNGERLGQGRDNVKVYLQEHPDFANEIDKLIRADAGRLSFARGGKTVAPKKETAAPAAAEPAASPASPARGRNAAVNIDVEVDE